MIIEFFKNILLVTVMLVLAIVFLPIFYSCVGVNWVYHQICRHIWPDHYLELDKIESEKKKQEKIAYEKYAASRKECLLERGWCCHCQCTGCPWDFKGPKREDVERLNVQADSDKLCGN